MSSWCTVAWLAGGRSRGVSPSNPSSTWRLANSGQYWATGAVTSSLPRSISWSAAAVATILVIDMIRKCVAVLTGSCPPTSR